MSASGFFLGQLSLKTKISNDPISLSAPCFLNYNYLSNRDRVRDHLRILQQHPHQTIYRLFEWQIALSQFLIISEETTIKKET